MQHHLSLQATPVVAIAPANRLILSKSVCRGKHPSHLHKIAPSQMERIGGDTHTQAFTEYSAKGSLRWILMRLYQASLVIGQPWLYPTMSTQNSASIMAKCETGLLVRHRMY